MTDLGRTIAIVGGLMLAVGLGMMILGRLGAPRIPGDIYFRRGGATFYFPIVSSILLSIFLTILLNLFLRKR